VDQLLEHQMPPGLPAQVGVKQDSAEILQVAVQVAAHQYIVNVFENHQEPAPARRLSKGVLGLAEGPKESVGIWHRLLE
jgi:hypothetical protein